MIIKKNSYKISEARKYLNKKGLELFKKSNQLNSNNTFKSFFYTSLCSFLIISFFIISPQILNIKNNLKLKSFEIKNNSKVKLEKLLTSQNKSVEEKKKKIR